MMSDAESHSLEDFGLSLAHHTLMGAVDPQESINVMLKLRRKQSSKLPSHEAFLAGQRIFTKRAEFAKNHGACSHDIAEIEAWATTNGLVIAEVNAATRSLHVVGSADLLEKIFAVSLRHYQHQTSGDTFRAHEELLTVPSELQDKIEGVYGLDNCQIVHPSIKMVCDSITGVMPDADNVVPAAGQDLSNVQSQFPGTYLPPQVAELYNFPKTTGKGQKVAILEFGGGFSQATLQDYFTKVIGLQNVPKVTAYSVLGTAQNISGGATGEVYLDIEVVGAMAPDAEIDVYFAPFTAQGFLKAIETAIHNKDYAAVSISYGLSEDASTWTGLHNSVDEVFKEAATMGIPVFVSAGDNGDGNLRQYLGHTEITPVNEYAHASYPATSPYATACGGTQLYADNKSITNEVVWNEQAGPLRSHSVNYSFYIGGSTGGGVSDRYPVPSYQSNAGLQPKSANPGAKAGRSIPDVAGNAGATTGYIVSQPPGSGYTVAPVGGTSAVAPMWAALTALAKQSLQDDGMEIPAFFFNDFIYDNGTSSAFVNINGGRATHFDSSTGRTEAGNFTATGNNKNTLKANGYYSRNGFDQCTGFGRPDGVNLTQQLKTWLKSTQS